MRLAIGGGASLILLVWLTHAPGAVSPARFADAGFEVAALIGALVLSSGILVLIAPLLRKKSSDDCWLALMIGVFPATVLGLILLKWLW